MPRVMRAGPAALVLLLLTAGAAGAATRLYSYDPANDAARALAQTGLTFRFDRGLIGGEHLREVIQTGDRGSADVKPGSERDLGAGGLKAALKGERPAGDLYEIAPEKEGKAFVGAVCPGAARAWLLVGAMRPFHDLTVQAVGRDAGAASPHFCATLTFTYRNAWTLPSDRGPPSPKFSSGFKPE